MSVPAMLSLQSLKPALLFACAGALTTAALHFPSAHHPYFLPPILFITAWSLASVDGDATSGGPLGLDSYTAITCLVFTFILLRILFFERHSLLYYGDKVDKPGGDKPSPCTTAPHSWTVLARFAVLRASKAGAIILIDYLVVQNIRKRLTSASGLHHFTPDQEPIIRRLLNQDNDNPVSSHELLLRAFMSISWIWANVLVLESYHALLAIVFVVILQLDDPSDWPPLFGSPTDAWTVRRFWGKFWHRIVTPTFAWYARPLSRSLLRCKPGSSLDNTVTALCIFFLSGLMHAVVAWRTGQGYAHLDLLFFTSNFMVVLLETLISKVTRGLGKTAYGEALRDPRVQRVGRALGYVWVFAWFFWAVPRWIYPKTLRWSIKQAIVQYRS